MKKVYSLSVFIIIGCLCGHYALAQGIYQLWGTHPYGGPDDGGSIFTTKFDGTAYTVKKTFAVTNSGKADDFNKPVVYNNKFYSLMNWGGLGNGGVIAEFDPATNAWSLKAELKTLGVKEANGSLTLYNNKMYGVGRYGGVNGYGIIFEFNPANSSFVKIYDFGASNAIYPEQGLTLYNNKLYGISRSGGTNGDGVLYEFNPANNSYATKVSFQELISGQYPSGALTSYGGKLWGTTSYGGQDGAGVLFSYDPDTEIFSKKVNFKSAAIALPYGGLTVYNNKLYGSTINAEDGSNGAIFEYDPANNSLAKKANLNFSLAWSSIEFTVYNNLLYSCTSAGGNDYGALFSFNPANNQQQMIKSLDDASGLNGCASLSLYNNKLYGFTKFGGNYGLGTLFSYTPANGDFDALVHFGGPELRTPNGPVMYYNNKIYGTAFYGGTNKDGGIYEYNIATGVYSVKVNIAKSVTGRSNYDQGGFTLFNNKFYGVGRSGGSNDKGVLFEYDPMTNTLTKKHDFGVTTGGSPYGRLVEFNGKLYGTCSDGSTYGNGNIYEFDPASGIYMVKVHLQGAGSSSRSGLVVYNNKLYGTSVANGAFSRGTVFEYDPSNNSYAQKASFNGSNGYYAWGNMTVYNDKLYGMSFWGGSKDSGAIYEYDPATVTITKKADLTSSTGVLSISSFTVLNGKMYAMPPGGGAYESGTLLQFDPVSGILTKKRDFSDADGTSAYTNNLTAIPAPAAYGSPGSCVNTQTINIGATKANDWIAFTDAEGRAVGEINANGNELGNTAIRLFVNDGNVRQNVNGHFYLDRNITITVENQPATPVSIRLYIRKTELETLKGTAGSGVVVPADLSIYHNNDFCAPAMNTNAVKVATTVASWGADYVYMADVPSFSSFYFAAALEALPVHIESFSGKALPEVNALTWRASCTNAIDFTIERSQDGIHYAPITTIAATQQDCMHAFVYNDATYLPGKNYYRLKMNDMGNVTMSKIIVLDRAITTQLQLSVLPNPVTGTQAKLQIISPSADMMEFHVADIAGRTWMRRKIQVAAGLNAFPLSLEGLAAGVYYIRYSNGQNWQTIKFVKQ